MPLKALYKLYRALGEPHIVRTFLFMIRYPSHLYDHQNPDLEENNIGTLLNGHNMYVFSDEVNYVIGKLI